MTTYAPPPKYYHGEFPTDTDPDTATSTPLEPLNTALSAIAELYTDGSVPVAGETLPKLNYAVYWNREKGEAWGSRSQEGSDYWVFHKTRYLHYVSTGAIVDPAGLGDDVSLPNNDDFNVYDLDSVSWLVYGAVYRVTGVDFCCEDVDP